MPERPRNERLLRALAREPVDMTPVWLMRQAGRYLPEYRKLRARTGDFLSLCKTPELACEVTLQPLRRFPLDAAILFSDILTIPDAMGLGLSVEEGVGPKFERVVRSAADVRALGVPDPEADLGYVMDSIRLVRRELDGSVPLIGFAGSPWTLATYMVEGGGSRDFRLVKSLMYGESSLLHVLLAKLSEALTVYLNAQIAAGAQVVMIFDTWGGILSTADYLQFSLRYLAQIVAGLTRYMARRQVPVIVFTKGSSCWLGLLAETGCDALGLDWTTDITQARREVGTRVALQGNLDPCALFAPPDKIRAEVASLLERFGAGAGHVFNLGHGVMPEVDPENVAVLIDAVHELSKPWHRAL
ncbi:MAG: uroporphyrinogen decarboxylase [Gammaproteobacteria bacterium]